jgi:hypothetical protein
VVPLGGSVNGGGGGGLGGGGRKHGGGGLLAGEEGAELGDGGHQRGWEYHGGVLVHADLDEALQVAELEGEGVGHHRVGGAASAAPSSTTATTTTTTTTRTFMMTPHCPCRRAGCW